MEVAKAKVNQQTRSRYHARESMELARENMEPASEPALSGKKRHRRDALENMEPWLAHKSLAVSLFWKFVFSL